MLLQSFQYIVIIDRCRLYYPLETKETYEMLARKHVEMPPKPGIHPGGGDSFIHAMPAYIPALKSAGLKWVSGFPDNYKRGLPYITGLVILNDVETGLPLSKIGTREFLERLLYKIAHREGFGDILAEGMMRVRDKVSDEARALFPHGVAPVGQHDGVPPRAETHR